MKRSKIELKPCPFCGAKFSKDFVKRSGIVWKGRDLNFECPTCGAHGPLPNKGIPYRADLTDEEADRRDVMAAQAWNMREET